MNRRVKRLLHRGEKGGQVNCSPFSLGEGPADYNIASWMKSKLSIHSHREAVKEETEVIPVELTIPFRFIPVDPNISHSTPELDYGLRRKLVKHAWKCGALKRINRFTTPEELTSIALSECCSGLAKGQVVFIDNGWLWTPVAVDEKPTIIEIKWAWDTPMWKLVSEIIKAAINLDIVYNSLLESGEELWDSVHNGGEDEEIRRLEMDDMSQDWFRHDVLSRISDKNWDLRKVIDDTRGLKPKQLNSLNFLERGFSGYKEALCKHKGLLELRDVINDNEGITDTELHLVGWEDSMIDEYIEYSLEWKVDQGDVAGYLEALIDHNSSLGRYSGKELYEHRCALRVFMKRSIELLRQQWINRNLPT